MYDQPLPLILYNMHDVFYLYFGYILFLIELHLRLLCFLTHLTKKILLHYHKIASFLCKVIEAYLRVISLPLRICSIHLFISTSVILGSILKAWWLLCKKLIVSQKSTWFFKWSIIPLFPFLFLTCSRSYDQAKNIKFSYWVVIFKLVNFIFFVFIP